MTNGDEAGMTKRGSETSLNNHVAAGASYAMHGMIGSVENAPFNFEGREKSSSTGGSRPTPEQMRSGSYQSASSLEARMNGFSIPVSARKAVAAGIAKGLNQE